MLFQEKIFPCAKIAFILFVTGWGIASIHNLSSNMGHLATETTKMKDQYVGLHLANSEFFKALENTNSQVRFQSDMLKSNQDLLVKMLTEQQKQIDGLKKFLMKTQPQHKAILQSLTGEVLEE